MRCEKCGAAVSDTAKFCPECGARIIREKRTIQLRCKSCGGTLSYDGDEPILTCPFCGSKELIDESDLVTIQRIRSRTEKEIELERLKFEEKRHLYELEREEKAEAEERLEKYKRGKLRKRTILFMVIFLLISVGAFQSGELLPGLIALAQTILLLISWLAGMQIIKEKFRSMHSLAALLAFVLIIPFAMASEGNSNTSSDAGKTYIWPTSGINTILPQPKSDKGYIIDSKDSFHLSVLSTSDQDYVDYVDACIKEGFTIDADRGSTSYEAYNEEGYWLSVSHFGSNGDMKIDLDAPKANGTYKWPDSEIAKLLPQPKSSKGKMEWEADYGFVLYVGDTTVDDFKEYAEACSQNGFNVEYRSGETYYYADNSDGYHLSLKYKGNNTMFVRIDDPDEES